MNISNPPLQADFFTLKELEKIASKRKGIGTDDAKPSPHAWPRYLLLDHMLTCAFYVT